MLYEQLLIVEVSLVVVLLISLFTCQAMLIFDVQETSYVKNGENRWPVRPFHENKLPSQQLNFLFTSIDLKDLSFDHAFHTEVNILADEAMYECVPLSNHFLTLVTGNEYA